MQSTTTPKVLFVINPKSGPRNLEWEILLTEQLEKWNVNYQFLTVTEKLTSEMLAEEIKKYGPDKVISIGGDGTIKLVCEQLAGTTIPLGIIPGGSANGMAKELNIPMEFPEALALALNGNARQIDVIRINNELCIHLSDIGLNAFMIKQFENQSGRGYWGYTKALIKAMWKRTLIKVSITLDGKTIQRKAYMIVIANATKYGTGAIINPLGKLDDGMMEIVIMRKIPLIKLSRMLFKNKPFDPAIIEAFPTSRVKIVSRHKYYFQVDGEYRGRLKEIDAWVQREHLSVITP